MVVKKIIAKECFVAAGDCNPRGRCGAGCGDCPHGATTPMAEEVKNCYKK